MLPIHISVVRAFFHSGCLNAGTPFEIASTPVTAAPPEANACRTRKTVSRCVAVGTSNVFAAVESAEEHAERDRSRCRTPIITMKKYVGTAKIRPDSLMPRRLPSAMSAMNATEMCTRQAKSTGDGRHERRSPGRDGHRNSERVVGEQRDAGDLGRQDPEVVARDDVCAAAVGVGLDRLAVGEQQDREDREHRDRDRQRRA